MVSLPVRKGLIFVLIGCAWITIFLGSCSEKSDSLPQTAGNEPRHVEILDGNGQSIARLQESKPGDTLWLTLANQEPIIVGECGDQVTQTAVFPEAAFTAVVYVRNCGASTDWATRVDLVSAIKEAGRDDSNTIVIVKGSQPVTIEWENDKKIIISLPRMDLECIYKQQTQSGGILIEYNETIERAEETRYVEVSNFDFGNTGTAAGMHEEILLRMAGWAQEKSGLIRSEWGNWIGDPPYGDDPKEHKLIKLGIQFYQENRDKILNEEK